MKKEAKYKCEEAFLPPARSLENPLCRIVLVEPLIPENTGNISRTCVGINAELHLVEPLGFELTQSRVKRAGLDYWDDLALQLHPSFDEWHEAVASVGRTYFIETWGEASIYDVKFQRGDWLVFGKETTGLKEQKEKLDPSKLLKIPVPGKVRSLNLSNAVAITAYEVLRQLEVELGAPLHKFDSLVHQATMKR